MRNALLTLLAFTPLAFGEVDVTTNRGEGTLQQTFQLTLEARQNSPAAVPDFSVLETKFQIIDRKQLSLSDFKSGTSRYQSRWILTLRPRQTGSLVIPSILVGTERSLPVRYNVQDPQETVSQDRVRLELTLTPEEVYVNAASTLAVRLLYRDPLLSAELTEPAISNVWVQRIGEQTSFQVQHNDIDYQGIEQRYLLSPGQAGLHELPPLEFNGSLLDENGEAVDQRFLSESVTLEALPIPSAESSQHWLPATSVIVTEQWGQPLENIIVGDTRIRTLTLTTRGIPAHLIPAPKLPKINGVTIESLPATAEQKEQNGELVSYVTFPFQLLFTTVGPLTLPPVEVRWWNTRNDQAETTQLNSHTLTIRSLQPAVLSAVATSPAPAGSQPVKPELRPAKPLQENDDYRMPAWSGWLWAAIAIISSIGWTYARQQNRRLIQEIAAVKASQQTKQPISNEDRFRQQEAAAFGPLAGACHRQDPVLAAEAMIQWGKYYWPDAAVGSLEDIDRCAADPTLSYLLRDLQYRLSNEDEDDNWHGGLVLAQIERLRKRRNRPARAVLNDETSEPETDIVVSLGAQKRP